MVVINKQKQEELLNIIANAELEIDMGDAYESAYYDLKKSIINLLFLSEYNYYGKVDFSKFNAKIDNIKKQILEKEAV